LLTNALHAEAINYKICNFQSYVYVYSS